VRVIFNFAIWMQKFWSWSANNIFIILSYESGFYEPTVFKIHLPVCGITVHVSIPGKFDHTSISFCLKLLIQKNGGLSPRGHSHESSTLTTRLQLLVKNIGLMLMHCCYVSVFSWISLLIIIQNTKCQSDVAQYSK
jgi:hypothetical protein